MEERDTAAVPIGDIARIVWKGLFHRSDPIRFLVLSGFRIEGKETRSWNNFR